MPVVSESPPAEKRDLSPLTVAPITHLCPPVRHRGIVALTISCGRTYLHASCSWAQGRRLFKHLDRCVLGRALAELETRWVEETLRGLLACPLTSKEKQKSSSFQNAIFERLVKKGIVSLPENLLQALCHLHGHGHTQPLLRGLDATL